MTESRERGFWTRALRLPVEGQGRVFLAIAAVDAGIAVLALLSAGSLAFIAALAATLLSLGRYLAMGAYARGIAGRAWLLPLSVWIALFGLLALLLYLAGRKGLILWPALVALSAPVFLNGQNLLRALLSFGTDSPFRRLAQTPVPPATSDTLRGGTP